MLVAQLWYPDTATPTATPDPASSLSAAPPLSPIPGKKLTLKEKWKNLKEEDKKRKEEQIKYISEEDATKITGYGKDGGPKTRDEEKNGYVPTGVGKVFKAFLKLS